MIPNSIDVKWCETHQVFFDNCPDAIIVGSLKYIKTVEAEELNA